ncbi:MAG: radical SAM family heme chaperone HemW [Chloroflexi bacterium]|nr:radical SAM family heme chaperone HemW [Chloroflexota bacterium]
MPRYVAALQTELSLWHDLLQEGAQLARLGSLYFGGGTPTVMRGRLADVLQAALRLFDVENDVEISLETNPGMTSVDDLAGLRKLGMNRVSMGIQSFDDSELRLLGRIHNAEQAIESFASLRSSGFDNLGIDLMYGLPGQGVGEWRHSLEQATRLGPEHLSLYALTIEEATPIARDIEQGRVERPDPDACADMYSLAEDLLQGAGYRHYEISNWARPGRECRHNINYWRDGHYLGVGAGAHGYLGQCRIANLMAPLEYVEFAEGRSGGCYKTQPPATAGPALRSGFVLPVESMECIPISTEMAETMMLGLRLVEGVSGADFEARFDTTIDAVYGRVVFELVGLGLLERAGAKLRLTRRGRLLGNEVFCRFV